MTYIYNKNGIINKYGLVKYRIWLNNIMVLEGIKLMVFLILSVVTLYFNVYIHYCSIIHSLLHLLVYFPSLNCLVVMEWKGYLKFLFAVYL